ncbi:MAG: RHS repeat-associated core domain-containing protein, partial [Planctomycetota bacterium]
GRAFDDETGLQNNLHRWYDPVTGRWASEDPIGFAAGDANLYRYVGNFSTGATDPEGEFWGTIGGAIVGGIVGGAVSIGSSLLFEGELPSGADLAGAVTAGAVSGAIVGGVLTADPTVGAAIAVGAVAGAAGGATGSVVRQSLDDRPGIDGYEVLRDTGYGAAGGAAGGALGHVLRNVPTPGLVPTYSGTASLAVTGTTVLVNVPPAAAIASGCTLAFCAATGGSGGDSGNYDPVREEYDSFEDAVGDSSLEGSYNKQQIPTDNPGLAKQGFTEKWIGQRGVDDEWASACRNPSSGKWTGGKPSSHVE